MPKFVRLYVAFSATGTPTPRITHVDGYPLGWLREPAPGTPSAASQMPTNMPQRPQSMRVLYRPVWRPDDFGGTALGGGINVNLTSDGVALLIISGDGLATGTVSAKLIDPTAVGSGCWAAAPWNPLNAAVAPGILGAPTTIKDYATNSNFYTYFVLPTAEYDSLMHV